MHGTTMKIFCVLSGVGMIILNFGLGTDCPGRDISALSHYPFVLCAEIELTTRKRPHLFADPFYLVFTVNVPFDNADGKKLIVSV
jgi:hypothetical protein